METTTSPDDCEADSSIEFKHDLFRVPQIIYHQLSFVAHPHAHQNFIAHSQTMSESPNITFYPFLQEHATEYKVNTYHTKQKARGYSNKDFNTVF
jgi:hypothetical protein